MAILKDVVTGKGEILDRVNEGDTLDSSINAMAAATYKDNSGNAVYPTLNPDGTIPTSPDAGIPFNKSEIVVLASQTKDLREEHLTVALDVAAGAINYSRPDFKVTCYAECLVEMELIIDKGLGGEAITALGYGATNDMHINDEQKIIINSFVVPGGATTAALRLMVTPFEDGNQGDDIRLTASVNKLSI